MRRATPSVAIAVTLLAGSWITAGAERQAQDQQPQITVYKGPT